MAVYKILLTLAFTMGFVICIQGLTVSRNKKNYRFGKHKDGDVTIPATRNFWHDEDKIINVLLELRIPDKKLRAKLKNKDPKYTPKISEIIVNDPEGLSTDCKFVDGGPGSTYVTLEINTKEPFQRYADFLKYLITLKGQ